MDAYLHDPSFFDIQVPDLRTSTVTATQHIARAGTETRL